MYISRSRRIIAILLTTLAVIGIFFCPFASIKSGAAEDYRLWRQSDPRWSGIRLGNSSETVRSSGCLVTALAILAVHSGSADPETFNPGVLANELNKLNGFSNGAISSWANITKIIPDVKFVKKYKFTSSSASGKAEEMKKITDEGNYIVCNTGNHWVFIDAIIGSDVYMIDPAKDEVKLFEAYKLSNITELRVFTGKNKFENTLPEETIGTPVGEYYNLGSEIINIYASPSEKSHTLEYLRYGQLVEVTEINKVWGSVQLGTETGWIDLRKLTYADDSAEHQKGDINNDGNVDKADLALLNDYLLSLTELPDGINILRKCEAAAADINSDGIVNHSDSLKYLEIICE